MSEYFWTEGDGWLNGTTICYVTPCSLTQRYLPFDCRFCLKHQGITHLIKMSGSLAMNASLAKSEWCERNCDGRKPATAPRRSQLVTSVQLRSDNKVGVRRSGSKHRSVAVWRVTLPHIAARQSNAFPFRHKCTINGPPVPLKQETEDKEIKFIILCVFTLR
jgi:hypothetical protein